MSKNLGRATAARMPKMVITTTSSMIVNPAIFFIYSPYLRLKLEVVPRILHQHPLLRKQINNVFCAAGAMVYVSQSISHLNGGFAAMNGWGSSWGSPGSLRTGARTTRKRSASGGGGGAGRAGGGGGGARAGGSC